ncbi:MAG: permease [Myxococcota bacterium]
MDRSVLALILAIGALLAAPVLSWFTRGTSWLRAALDGFVLVVVAGVALLHLGPHAVAEGGVPAMVGIALGVGVPAWLHQTGRRELWAGAAMVLLAAHSFLDGAALGILDAGLTTAVGAGVTAHRLPVGLAVVAAARRPLHAALALGGLAALTVLGFNVGMVADLPHWVQAITEGLIVGGLLHVVFVHRVDGAHDHAHSHDHGHAHGHTHTHEHRCHGARPADRRASAVGALLGVLTLGGLAALSGGSSALVHLQASGRTFLSLTITSAPALLAGFVIAGLVSAFLDPARARWLSGGVGTQALRGVAFGLPLPVCSCGVVPMYQSLIRRGVPVTAGLAFLVATPELGIDAVFLSVPLLGLPMTIARVGAAFAVALGVAVIVGRGAPTSQPVPIEADATLRRGFGARMREGLRFGLVDLVDHTLPWILVGLVLAALAEPLLDPETLAALPSVAQVPLAALLGVPIYVCASGATPLAALAAQKGLSAGAALAFLLAGPATNVTTFGVLSALHGRRLAVQFGLVLTIAAVGVGWAVDAIGLTVPVLASSDAAHGHGWGGLGLGSAIGVGALTFASLWRQGARGMVGQITNPIHVH